MYLYRRDGWGKVITSVEAEKLLAMPCFYILAGQARPMFPMTTRAYPSPFVLVQMQGQQIREKDHHSFGWVTVDATQWERAVAPVLNDPEWDVRLPLFKSALRTGRIEKHVAEVGAALKASFEEAGYGPPQED